MLDFCYFVLFFMYINLKDLLLYTYINQTDHNIQFSEKLFVIMNQTVETNY
jgi:hypothetical protein